MITIPLSLLATAIPGAKLSGRRPILFHRLSADSRDIQPGDLFACVRGARQDGHRFAAAAVRRGAVAVLADRPLPGLDLRRVGLLRVKHVAESLARVAPQVYNHPAQQVQLVGVTGTNGKTTITHLLREIMRQEDYRTGKKRRVGVIGTISHDIAGESLPAANTTPMAWDVQRLLALMVDQRCDLVVMEVSSHALAEARVTGCEFDVGVFTNLTREHLDYHGTLSNYAVAKRRLFRGLAAAGDKTGKVAVINQDDPYGASMAKAAHGVRVLTYGFARRAKVRAERLALSARGSRFHLVTPQGSVTISLALLGQHNVYNALAAAATAQCLGAGLATIRKGLEALRTVPGRMQRVPGPQPFSVIVVYAHTPDALEKILIATREITPGRLIIVFGCGGDRDRGKRAPMGEIAARLADQVVVTSDNPRSEDPRKIIREVLRGCQRVNRPGKPGLNVQVDRARAIQTALRLARRGDAVLIAGKGHEDYQIFRNRVAVFDDRDVARRQLAGLSRRRTWKK